MDEPNNGHLKTDINVNFNMLLFVGALSASFNLIF